MGIKVHKSWVLILETKFFFARWSFFLKKSYCHKNTEREVYPLNTFLRVQCSLVD